MIHTKTFACHSSIINPLYLSIRPYVSMDAGRCAIIPPLHLWNDRSLTLFLFQQIDIKDHSGFVCTSNHPLISHSPFSDFLPARFPDILDKSTKLRLPFYQPTSSNNLYPPGSLFSYVSLRLCRKPVILDMTARCGGEVYPPSSNHSFMSHTHTHAAQCVVDSRRDWLIIDGLQICIGQPGGCVQAGVNT